MSYNIGEVINVYFKNGTLGQSVVFNSSVNQPMMDIPVASGEGGILDCSVVAVDGSGNAAIMRKIVRFSKTPAGVLSMGTANSLINDIGTGMTGTTFTQAVVNNNIQIQVKGPTTLKDVRWQLDCIQNSCSLNLAQ
jgi:hypothetical protein